MTPDIKPAERQKAAHKCTVCGNVAAWSDSWSWYGSIRDLEGGEPIIKICSATCQANLDAEEGGPEMALSRMQKVHAG